MNKQLILFDLDGTLLNTLGDLSYCMNQMLDEYNLPRITNEDTRRFIGHGARYYVSMATNGNYTEEMLSSYVSHQVNCKNTFTTLYPGIDELLINLKQRGYLLGIVSNKPDEVTQVVYKDLLQKYNFDYVMGGNIKLFPPKPDKLCVEYCLNKMNISKDKVIYIGDSDVDVILAHNSGVDDIAVTWGYRDVEDIKKEKPKCIVNNTIELFEEIRKYEGKNEKTN